MRVVVPSIARPSVATPSTITPRDGRAGAPLASVTIAISESWVYAVERSNVRNGLIGAKLSRACFGFTHASTLRGVDIAHQGSGADCRLSSAALATATRTRVALSSGDQDAATVAQAIADELIADGVTGCTIGTPYMVGTVEFCDLSIPGASDPIMGAPMAIDHESTRGMWGSQRTDFGTGNTGNTGNVGATPSYILEGPAADHRIIAVYLLNTGGVGDCRVGLSDAPAYTAGDMTFTGGVEGIATIGTDGTRLLILDEPVYEAASANKGIHWRAAGAGAVTVAFRPHGSSPVGRGDLPLSRPLASSAAAGDDNPATPIFTSGSWTHVHATRAAGSPFSVYSSVGYVYELPDAGEYYGAGDGAIWQGYHGAYDYSGNGAPTNATAATLETITETFRHRIRWPCSLVAVRYAMAAVGAGDSAGGAVYDWTGLATSTAPVVGSPPRLSPATTDLAITTGAGYKTHTYATPIDLDAADICGVSWAWNNGGGGIATIYDTPTSGTISLTQGFGTAWLDDGRTWCDQVDSGYGPRGIDAQYLTLNDADMPTGEGAATVWPNPFDPAVTDLTPDNHFRHAIRLEFPGISVVA